MTVMGMGYVSEVGRIERLLLKHPRDAFLDAANIRQQWNELNYTAPPDYEKACEEYDRFVILLKKHVSDVCFLPRNDRTGLDSIYVRDSSIMTKNGVVLANMGKKERSGEPKAVRDFLEELGIPVIGAIAGEGRLEGGDVVMWDERTLIVGLGYRTNEEGIRQLKELLKDEIEEFVIVSLPHWKGPEDVMHVMSLISPVDHNCAVVYSPLLPVSFRNWLVQRSVELVEVPGSEFDSMGCNILAVAPGKCIMIKGNPQTKQKLLDRGVDVYEYRGDEISVKGAGGPTCLTRPLLRTA